MLAICIVISMAIIIPDMMFNVMQPIERFYKATVLQQYLIELLALILAKLVLLTEHQTEMGLCFPCKLTL